MRHDFSDIPCRRHENSQRNTPSPIILVIAPQVLLKVTDAISFGHVTAKNLVPKSTPLVFPMKDLGNRYRRPLDDLIVARVDNGLASRCRRLERIGETPRSRDSNRGF